MAVLHTVSGGHTRPGALPQHLAGTPNPHLDQGRYACKITAAAGNDRVLSEACSPGAGTTSRARSSATCGATTASTPTRAGPSPPTGCRTSASTGACPRGLGLGAARPARRGAQDDRPRRLRGRGGGRTVHAGASDEGHGRGEGRGQARRAGKVLDYNHSLRWHGSPTSFLHEGVVSCVRISRAVGADSRSSHDNISAREASCGFRARRSLHGFGA